MDKQWENGYKEQAEKAAKDFIGAHALVFSIRHILQCKTMDEKTRIEHALFLIKEYEKAYDRKLGE